MNNGSESHPVKKIKQVVDRLSEKYPCFGLASSPAHQTPKKAPSALSTVLEDALNFEGTFFNEILADRELLVHHDYYYEDYKSLIILLDDLRVRRSQSFRKVLLTTAILHIQLEKIYLNYLQLNHDVIVDKLLQNGEHLLNLLEENFDQSIFSVLMSLGPIRGLEERQNLHVDLHPFYFLKEIDKRVDETNFKRLLILRLRRFYLSVIDCCNALRSTWLFLWLEPIVRLIINWGNIFYFMPRVVSNLGNFCYHSFLLGSNSQQEKELTVWTRMKIQFARRWEVMFRDMLWLLNSILVVFVLTGSSVIWGLYFNAIFQWVETLLNFILLMNFTMHIKKMEEVGCSLVPDSEWGGIQSELNHRWDIDKEIMCIRLWNSIIIAICSICILPFLGAISPLIPLFASMLSLYMSYWQNVELTKARTTRRDLSEPFADCSKEIPNTSKPAGGMSRPESNLNLTQFSS